MGKWSWIFALAVFVALPAFADDSFPDLRGVWKGQSESIVSGTADPHHGGTPTTPPHYNSVPFTFTIEKQDGRRFEGTFVSPRQTESVIGVLSRTGAIYFVDTDGYAFAHLLAPNRMESCYLEVNQTGRVASCVELVKQP